MVKRGAIVAAMVRRWRQLRRRIGLGGLAGLAMLALGSAVVGAVPWFQAASSSRLARLAQHAVAPQRAGPVPAAAPGAERSVDRFVGDIPPLAQRTADLQVLFDCAQRAHVDLPKADYALRTDPGSPFVGYTISVPLRESYATLKAFIGDTLVHLPNASLDELRMARADSLGERLDASVRLTLHYRSP